MSKPSPNKRALDFYRAYGYRGAIVERQLGPVHKEDWLGFGDGIVMGKNGTIIFQATSHPKHFSNHEARLKKTLLAPDLLFVLHTKDRPRIHIISWTQLKMRITQIRANQSDGYLIDDWMNEPDEIL